MYGSSTELQLFVLASQPNEWVLRYPIFICLCWLSCSVTARKGKDILITRPLLRKCTTVEKYFLRRPRMLHRCALWGARCSKQCWQCSLPAWYQLGSWQLRSGSQPCQQHTAASSEQSSPRSSSASAVECAFPWVILCPARVLPHPSRCLWAPKADQGYQLQSLKADFIKTQTLSHVSKCSFLKWIRQSPAASIQQE